MLPFRNGRSRKLGASGLVFLAAALCLTAEASDPKPKKAKESKQQNAEQRPLPKPKNSPGEKGAPASFGSIPLPIGHEIKGLVLPDMDVEGHLRTRFEAG